MQTQNLTDKAAEVACNPSRDARQLSEVGGVLLAAGSLSVVVASIFYVLSPPAAIAPVLRVLPDAANAVIAGTTMMKAAGTSGVFGDLVMGIGALLLAIDRSSRHQPVATAGWTAIMFSLVVFEIVDAIVGFVMPPAAAAAEVATFEAFRNLYGVFFLVGTAIFGVGSVLALASETRGSRLGRSLACLGIVNGAAALTAAVLTFAGFPFAPLVGVTISAGAVLFLLIGVWVAMTESEPGGATLHRA